MTLFVLIIHRFMHTAMLLHLLVAHFRREKHFLFPGIVTGRFLQTFNFTPQGNVTSHLFICSISQSNIPLHSAKCYICLCSTLFFSLPLSSVLHPPSGVILYLFLITQPFPLCFSTQWMMHNVTFILPTSVTSV